MKLTYARAPVASVQYAFLKMDCSPTISDATEDNGILDRRTEACILAKKKKKKNGPGVAVYICLYV